MMHRTYQDTRCHWCGGCRWALPWCRWAVAGPGRTTSRRAERSSWRGRLAGGPPPTGTRSGRARWCPEHQWHHTAIPETMRGQGAVPVGGGDNCLRQISHVI